MSKPLKPLKSVEFTQERKDLIGRLLKNSPSPINWAMELKITKKLFLEYPYPEFWVDFQVPGFLNSMSSLRSLCGYWGIDYMKHQYNIFLYKEQANRQPVKLGDKVGEDLVLKKASKTTLKDFLR